MSAPTNRRYVTVALTRPEAAALYTLTALVLNDPDWFCEHRRDEAAIMRAQRKLLEGIRR